MVNCMAMITQHNQILRVIVSRICVQMMNGQVDPLFVDRMVYIDLSFRCSTQHAHMAVALED